MKLLRSAIAVSSGLALFLLVMRAGIRGMSGSPNDILIVLLATVATGVVSGYLTARIAGSHEFPHASALGFLLVIAGVVSMRAEGAAKPGGLQIAVAGCGPISALLGAAVRLITKR